MAKPDDIKLEQLEKRHKELKKDYEALCEQLNATGNAQDKNNLQRQIDILYKEMKDTDQQIEELKSDIENFDSTSAHSTDEPNPNIIPESYILIKIEP
ncbi:MAG: hypothetical protein ACKO2Z_31025, partial [Sphaerospermopsis kisseleviana]